MGYNQFRSRIRPTFQLPKRAPAPGSQDDFIAEIITFAHQDAKDAWIGLGLDQVPVPPVRLRNLPEDRRGQTVLNTGTGKVKHILLSKRFLGRWTKVEYAQVFIFEMGNVKKAPLHEEVFKQIKALSKSEYVRAIERIEWDFLKQLLAYIDAPQSPFEGRSVWTKRPKNFEEYFGKYTEEHRKPYEEEWEYYNS